MAARTAAPYQQLNVQAMNTNFYKYLTVGETEQENGIYVTTIGRSIITANDQYPKEKHPESHQLSWNQGRVLNDYYLVFISSGKGEFCSSLTEPAHIQEGTCFFLFPGIWHKYRPDQRSGWEEYWVGFNGAYIRQLMQSKFIDIHKPYIEIGPNKDLLVLFQKMADAVKASFVGYTQQIAGITLQLLGAIYAHGQGVQTEQSPVEKAITKAKFLLQESLEKPVDLPEIARQLPMGYSAFRKHFKTVTGLSPHQYLLNLRMDRARELLETTLLSVEQISEQTGFDCIQYFSTLFKKRMGISPVTYRKNFL